MNELPELQVAFLGNRVPPIFYWNWYLTRRYSLKSLIFRVSPQSEANSYKLCYDDRGGWFAKLGELSEAIDIIIDAACNSLLRTYCSSVVTE